VTASVLDQVRQAIEEAKAEGKEPPGRPTLVKLTGATDHQVKVALATLATAGAGESPATTSAPPAATNGHPAIEPDREDDPAATGPMPTVNGDKLPGLATAGDVAGDAGGSESPAATSVGDAGDPPVTTTVRGGKLVAWCGFAFGSVVSIAFNIMAASIAPKDAPADWRPSMFAQVGAAVWPVALLLSVEVLSRIPWPSGKGWKLARYGGVGTVAAGSAVISYQHISDVLLSWGYPLLSARVGPLVIDGLMTASGFAMLAIAGGRLVKPTTSTPPAGDRAGDRR
jgi:hypothetical protein